MTDNFNQGLEDLRALVDPRPKELGAWELAERYEKIREILVELRPTAHRTESERTVFEPWTDGFAVGFKVTREGRGVQFVYLNPSLDDGTEKGGDDGTVFLYQGPAGDPSVDPGLVHVDVFEP
jgi:hypothetical protein